MIPIFSVCTIVCFIIFVTKVSSPYIRLISVIGWSISGNKDIRYLCLKKSKDHEQSFTQYRILQQRKQFSDEVKNQFYSI